jgi:hypothetical protein
MMNPAISTDLPAAGATRPGFRFATVARAARAAVQWRLLGLWTVVLLIPTALAALPMWSLLSASLDHSVHAAELAANLDLSTITDLVVAHDRHATGFGTGWNLALLATALLSPLLAGMTIHASRAPETPRLRALVSGGVDEYLRMLRMLVWAVVPLGVTAALAAIAFGAAHGWSEKSVLESSASHARIFAFCVTALLFVIADASLDAGRAVLAGDRRRRSAVKAWWHGVKLVMRSPLAALGTYLGITVAGLVLAALFAIARLNVPALGVGGFVGAFVLTQLAVCALAWMKSARLFAMLELVRHSR